MVPFALFGSGESKRLRIMSSKVTETITGGVGGTFVDYAIVPPIYIQL